MGKFVMYRGLLQCLFAWFVLSAVVFVHHAKESLLGPECLDDAIAMAYTALLAGILMC